MAELIITVSLEKEINKHFKHESIRIFNLFLTLEENPKKGKLVEKIGKCAIKELKYKMCRFYFITDAYQIKFLKNEELADLLIKLVRMSHKHDQQKVINEIKSVLASLGEEGF